MEIRPFQETDEAAVRGAATGSPSPALPQHDAFETRSVAGEARAFKQVSHRGAVHRVVGGVWPPGHNARPIRRHAALIARPANPSAAGT
jgi:hypothetical protein